MSKTLYRTYRPQSFKDVLGQEIIVKTLQNAITQNRIGHAYLFTGPRGTGKTTVARLFAVAINTQKREGFDPVSDEVAQRLQDGTCLDIIEIDAASNTGVNDIRTLKENIGVTPSEAKYKVYIIDEVHMLSTSAFNALLKTLEEPPEHAVFILATTEIHKVPATIISRCQRFDFARFTIEDIIKKLTLITKTEQIKISPEALEMIAIAADGGMRDAESLLAQIISLEDSNITAKTVSQALGTTTNTETLTLLTAFVQKDITKAMLTINSVVQNGYNMEAFIRTIIEKLRILLFLSLGSQHKDIRDLISIPKKELETLQKISEESDSTQIITMIEECTVALQKTKNTTIIQLPLEVVSVNICGTKVSSTDTNSSHKKQTDTSQNMEDKSQPQKNPQQTNSTKNINTSDLKCWKESITAISKENTSIGKLLTQCEMVEMKNNKITLITTFSFYQDKIMQSENRTMIENILTDKFNKTTKINITLKDKTTNPSSELLDYAKQLMNNKTVTE
jgi:DNA polymerase-3 subunit gamma/tau